VNLTSSIVVGATDPFSGPPAEYHDKLTAVKTFALAINESAKAPCAGLQPGQLYADAGAAENDGAVVADQPAREADQDRRKGRHPRSLRHFQAAEGAVSRQMFQGLAGTPQASINVAGIRAVRQHLEPSLYCISIDPLCEG
jgi:hypothetical protein